MAETWKFPEAVKWARRDVNELNDGRSPDEILRMVRQERKSIERCNWADVGDGYAAAYEHAAREQLQVLMARAEVGRG